MKKRADKVVKLLIVLSLFLQFSPFNAIAETVSITAQSQVSHTQENFSQLEGEELLAYLDSLTVDERASVIKDLNEQQLKTLAAFREKTDETLVTEEPQPDTEKWDVTDNRDDGDAFAMEEDAPESLGETDDEVEEVEEEVEEKEEQLGPALNFVNAGALLRNSDESSIDNLVLNKKAVYNPDSNAVDFQLEAYAKGSIVTEMTPADIVFVLDVTNSMNGPMGATDNTIRLTALKNAVTSFVNNLPSAGPDQYHRLRIVTFNTKGTPDPRQYRSNSAGDLAAFVNKVNGLTASGNTRQDKALVAADKIVQANLFPAASDPPKERPANQVIILFTDGEPHHPGSASKYQIAHNAVNNTAGLKQLLSTTVYSVGIQDGANPAIIDPSDVVNSMLNALSSNYPFARSFHQSSTYYTLDLGDRNPKGNYYLTANNAADLSTIFEQIANEIGGIADLTLKDVLAEEFFLPQVNGVPDLSSVKVYKAWEYAAGLPPIQDANLSYDQTSKTLALENITLDPVIFDDEGNPTEATKNNKYIIRFQGEINELFMGGNQVATNREGSGAYVVEEGSSQFLQAFDLPTVNIPIRGENLAVKDHKHYVGNVAQMADFFKTSAALDGQNNRYVNITYKLFKDNQLLKEVEILAGAVFINDDFSDSSQLNEDVTYRVSYKITPALEASNGLPGVGAHERDQESTLFLFYPNLKPYDRKIYLTNQLALTEKLPALVSWEHPKADELSELPFSGIEPTVVAAKLTLPTVGPLVEKVEAQLDEVTLSNEKVMTKEVIAAYSEKTTFFVYIFRPTIASTNVTLDLGASTLLAERHQATTWHNSLTTMENLEGNEPVLKLVPIELGKTTPASQTVTPLTETDYYWQVWVATQDISQESRFTNEDYASNQQPVGAHFTIYVTSASFLLSKEIVSQEPRNFGTESFIFEITWTSADAHEVYYEVLTLEPTETKSSQKLSNLKPGNYTVRELGDWSSRYDDLTTEQEFTLAVDTPQEAVFQNELKNTKWLTHESKVANTFKKRAGQR